MFSASMTLEKPQQQQYVRSTVTSGKPSSTEQAGNKGPALHARRGESITCKAFAAPVIMGMYKWMERLPRSSMAQKLSLLTARGMGWDLIPASSRRPQCPSPPTADAVSAPHASAPFWEGLPSQLDLKGTAPHTARGQICSTQESQHRHVWSFKSDHNSVDGTGVTENMPGSEDQYRRNSVHPL